MTGAKAGTPLASCACLGGPAGRAWQLPGALTRPAVPAAHPARPAADGSGGRRRARLPAGAAALCGRRGRAARLSAVSAPRTRPGAGGARLPAGRFLVKARTPGLVSGHRGGCHGSRPAAGRGALSLSGWTGRVAASRRERAEGGGAADPDPDPAPLPRVAGLCLRPVARFALRVPAGPAFAGATRLARWPARAAVGVWTQPRLPLRRVPVCAANPGARLRASGRDSPARARRSPQAREVSVLPALRP